MIPVVVGKGLKERPGMSAPQAPRAKCGSGPELGGCLAGLPFARFHSMPKDVCGTLFECLSLQTLMKYGNADREGDDQRGKGHGELGAESHRSLAIVRSR